MNYRSRTRPASTFNFGEILQASAQERRIHLKYHRQRCCAPNIVSWIEGNQSSHTEGATIPAQAYVRMDLGYDSVAALNGKHRQHLYVTAIRVLYGECNHIAFG